MQTTGPSLSKNAIAALIFISIMLNGTLSTLGQTTRQVLYPQGPKNQIHKQKQPCAGGWRGIVTYTKTLKDSLESDDPGIRKAIDRIKHKSSRDFEYAGRAVVDGSDPLKTAVSTNVKFTDNDLSWGQEKVFDTCNSRENGHWFIIEGTDDRQTQAQTSGSAKSFNLSVNEAIGIYQFSLEFPDAHGQFKHEEHTQRSGHCQPKNNEPFDRSTNEPSKINGESFTIDNQKVDPKNPDQLSGSKIWGDDGKGRVRTFLYQVSWRFTRCPAELLITELKYEHPKFPDFDKWKEIEDRVGTIDGNRVKIKAKVLNLSAEEKYANVKIKEVFESIGPGYKPPPDQEFSDGQFNIKLEAGEEREVEMIWDTEGQSWTDAGQENRLHYIKAEAWEGDKKDDEKERDLYIYPKPLVLVHGLWSSANVWSPLYQNLLGGYGNGWKAYPVGEKTEHGVMNMGGKMLSESQSSSVYENADQLAKYVRYAQEDSNAWHVDMVAHTSGGLVARLYLQKLMPNVPDARPQVKHLVMLGTPNGGVKCVDVFLGKLGLFKQNLNAARELTNEEMLNFNRYVVNTGGTKLSALAGNPVPVICGGMDWNDGFVTVASATFGVSDNGQSNDLSYQLTDAKNFGNFVKPHLVTGPKKTYPLPVKSDPTDWRRWQVDNGGIGAYRDPQVPPDSTASLSEFSVVRAGGPSLFDLENYRPVETPNAAFLKEVKLAPDQSLEIDLALDAGPNFGITFLADPSVSVSLINDKGIVVSKSLAASSLANSMFRSLFTSKPVSGGVWKLQIENTSKQEQLFAGYSWSIASQ